MTWNPAECELNTGAGEMSLDQSDSMTLQPIYSFVRFNLDGMLANKTIDTVTFRLTATSGAKAPSTHSGEIWQVAPFTKLDLDSKLSPAKMGGGAISPNQSAVAQLQQINWPLPVGIVGPNQSVFLGIFPLSSDGVNYWNLNGASPPQLIVVYH